MSFAPPGQTFVLNQKLISVGGDLWIDDAAGNHAFEVDGKAFALRRTLILKDPAGNPLYEINQSLAHLHTTFEIKRGDQVVATIQKALINVLGDHFTVTAPNGEQLAVTGDWIAREFHVTRAGMDVILASRRLVSLHGAYGVQIAPGFEAPLALAIIIALEQMELQEGHR
ncbi:MAG: LURP-one-related family protein [Candidatus Limnocylindrales bacterium]